MELQFDQFTSTLNLGLLIEMNKYDESIQKPQYETDTVKPHRPFFHGRLSIEEGGIERVTDEERQQNTTKFWHAATFW